MGIRLAPAFLLACLSVTSVGCRKLEGHDHPAHEESHPIVVTHPVAMEVETAQHYVSQIRASQHIELRALVGGYLEQICVQEGQAVAKGQLLFKLVPAVYRARLHADEAELQRAEISLRSTEQLAEKSIVSDQELALVRAERDRAKAKVELAEAELSFAEIRAPFDGIVDRQYAQLGSLLEEGDVLTTVSDNGLMWVYFNVPEVDYLGFQSIVRDDSASGQRHQLRIPGARIELQLANGELFEHTAHDAITIESDFDNETGNIRFRADFPNPEHLLRHGQTGTLWIWRSVENALVIPQRSTFEVLDRVYVFVVDDEGVAHQRAITIAQELDDIYIVESGLDASDAIVLEGVRQIREGQHVTVELREPAEALANMKMPAE